MGVDLALCRLKEHQMWRAMAGLCCALGLTSVGCSAPLAAQSLPAASQGPSEKSFLVVLNPNTPNVTAEAHRLVSAHGGQLGRVFQSALKGFVVLATPAVIERLRRDPQVVSIEEDASVGVDPLAK